MKDSPFIYGTTVSAHGFTNRERETAYLVKNLVGGINTTLISPRRWGKSSLVEKVMLEIGKKHKSTKTVMIDLFSVGTEEEFLETLAREVIKATSTKWQDWLKTTKEFFRLLVPKLTFGIDPTTDFTLSFDWKELKKHSGEILNLAEAICKKKKIKMIICLDEFQNLSYFPAYASFEKKLRASWQRHQLVTYCIYGSKRHMMTEIFNHPAKPFYRFGDLMLLQKIETKKWISFITGGFSKTGKTIPPDLAAVIPAIMKDHSWYVQQLSHYTWNLTRKKASVDEISGALNELLNANSPLYQKDIETISLTQLNLLKAISKGETKFTSVKVMNTYALGTPRNVSKNKDILIGADMVHEVQSSYEFLDPAFELWFRKQFFNENPLDRINNLLPPPKKSGNSK